MDHRYKRTNIAYKCKIFKAVNLIINGHYTYKCIVLKVFGIKTRKQNMPAKQGIPKWSLMIENKDAKCIVYIHITADLKAY